MEGGISKKLLIVWEVAAVAAAAVLVVITVLFVPSRTWYWYLILWLLGLTLVLCCFLWLPLLYESCRYEITPEYIEYQSGVVFFNRVRMLRRSIMYVTIVRGPLAPFLKTRTLVVFSMGGHMVLPCIELREAERLIQEITPKRPAIKARIFMPRKRKRP